MGEPDVAVVADDDLVDPPVPPLRRLIPHGGPGPRAVTAAALAIAGLTGLTLETIGPTASPLLVACLLALAVVVIGRRRPLVALVVAGALVGLAVSAGQVAGTDLGPAIPPTSLFGVALGLVLVLAGVGGGIVAILRRRWGALEIAVGVVAVGMLAVAAPEQALFVAQQVAGIGLLVVAGAIVLAEPVGDDGVRLADRFLRDDERSWDDRSALVAQLSFEGDDAGTRFARFMALMGFAATLASLGVIVDSTAIVIGAMLVAPLMTPLMATALSLAVGWPRRATRGLLVALAGIVLAVAVGALVGAIVPVRLTLATNPQVLSRIEPSLVDFAVALAAGGAGGFALARKDVSDALPGVAVAISLVPPLTVIGLLLETGDLIGARGASLLFATNVTSILLAGGAVFVLTGVVPSSRLTERSARRTLRSAVVFLVVPVLVGLSVSGHRLIVEDAEEERARQEVARWLENADDTLRLDGVEVVDEVVVVALTGTEDDLGDVDDLADSISRAVGRAIPVRLEITPRVLVEVDP